MIRSLVEDLTTEIYECEDGSEAVAVFREHHPDWVLMDVRMQPMDGLTATRQITQADPQARVVIVTNHTDSRTQQAAMKAGAVAFFGKDNLLALRSLIQPAPEPVGQ